MRIVFWQNMISPHLSPFIEQISKFRKNWEVILVVQTQILDRRIKEGWDKIESNEILTLVDPAIGEISDLLKKDITTTYHIFSGIFANQMVKQAFLSSLKLNINRILLTEYVNLSGYRKYFRRAYAFTVERRYRKYFLGVIGISSLATEWYKETGFKKEFIFPFWYTVKITNRNYILNDDKKFFRILYVGQLIKRKRVDWLLKAVKALPKDLQQIITVDIFGDGKMKYKLKKFAIKTRISNIVNFKGIRQNAEIRDIYTHYDLLVLPSIHDGWGAVVNESMLSGTQVLVSSRCGAKDLIDYSGFGTCFKFNDLNEFKQKLNDIIKQGKLLNLSRAKIHNWAIKNLHPDNAASYFVDIIEYINSDKLPKPVINWQIKKISDIFFNHKMDIDQNSIPID